MEKENDVISMDFPEYEEENPAIPDVKVDISFYENREAAYERNRRIAKEETAEEREEAFFAKFEDSKPSKLETFRLFMSRDLKHGAYYVALAVTIFASAIMWFIDALIDGRI